MRGDENDAAVAAQTVQRGERPRAYQSVLCGKRLIQRENRGGRQIQRIAEYDIAPLYRPRDLARRRLDHAPCQLQKLTDPGVLPSHQTDHAAGRRGDGQIAERTVHDVTEFKRDCHFSARSLIRNTRNRRQTHDSPTLVSLKRRGSSGYES